MLNAGSQCPDGLYLTQSPCEDPSATSFCSRFDATCGDGDNKWESCADEFPKLAAGSDTGQANTQACRVYHLKLAEASADGAKVHCPHSIKAGTGVCVDAAEKQSTCYAMIMLFILYLLRFGSPRNRACIGHLLAGKPC